ncbi:MAG TPA: iron-sulfur cluster assembly accessory protein [Candidatus Krumholzibacteria bacterium]|nr:iron-sulfur cluster assembly accessory protein [Candidatus Krumholzibacteria bacterium]
MGTFHTGKSELHGITLALRTRDEVYVGRCDDMNDEHVILLDADGHRDGEGGKSADAWLDRAAKFGVAPKLPRLVLPMADVTEYAPLGEYYSGVGKTKAAKPAAEPTPAPAAPAAADALVTLTDAAVKEVKRILADDGRPGLGLRLGVVGGGCSGLVYKSELDAPRDGDVVVPNDGFDVLLDRKSSIYLRGVTLDHQGGLDGRGFVFRNPNATNTCGCGESFSV